MGCCTGKEIEFQDLTPTETKALRASLSKYLGGKIGQTATPYKGQMVAGFDPMQLLAAQIMMGMQSKTPYQLPPTYGMPSGLYSQAAQGFGQQGANPFYGTRPGITGDPYAYSELNRRKANPMI